MKRYLLLLTLIGLFANTVCIAQTKEKKVEKDGFVWYEYKDSSGKKGAMNENGNVIIPAEHLDVRYNVSDHEFETYNYINHFVDGQYRRDGSAIIPESRGYARIVKFHDKDFGVYYNVSYEINGGKGVCDENGRELFSPLKGYSNVIPEKKDGISYFRVQKDGKEGICNIFGDEIIETQYTCIIYCFGKFEYEDSGGNFIDTGISLNDIAFSSPISQNSPVSDQTKTNSVQQFVFEERKEDLIQSKYQLDGNTLIPDGIDKESSVIGKITKAKTTVMISFDEYISITGKDEDGDDLFSFEDIELIKYAIEHPGLEDKEIAFEIYTKDEKIQIGLIWINARKMTVWHSSEDPYNFMDRFKQCNLSFPNTNIGQKQIIQNNKMYELLKKQLGNYSGKTKMIEIK